ncbi:aminotransferase class I/II-fold pyridoxal phosphate-dependent enzyme [Streptomyces sp. NPDC057257]|uniref:aminotransferase class I/II-fold pyridoxal phosphate-dependent enzyme n=1 Tax=Streptomyces sp. NPDC057257 TaxID=3346071 RepID=UPI00363E61E9
MRPPSQPPLENESARRGGRIPEPGGPDTSSPSPTYQQHYSIPDSHGARVDLRTLREENGWLPDLDELDRLVTPDTKLIAVNNHNSPTGALINEAGLSRIAEIADRVGAWVLCDEVYRGVDQDGDGLTTSIADLSARGISTGSMSKPFSLAGLGLGFCAGSLAPPRCCRQSPLTATTPPSASGASTTAWPVSPSTTATRSWTVPATPPAPIPRSSTNGAAAETTSPTSGRPRAPPRRCATTLGSAPTRSAHGFWSRPVSCSPRVLPSTSSTPCASGSPTTPRLC